MEARLLTLDGALPSVNSDTQYCLTPASASEEINMWAA